ncbi:MAG: hypothetical protein EBT02_07180 [Planctomycetia bacterium]|nr:redoxin domain-containing protein [Gemmataceae bacterium]NBT61544.1 hypothetical protein [Planctomycetia bacterium]
MLCRAHLGEIRDQYQSFKDINATVVAITFSSPAEALKLSQELKLPFLLVSDAQKEAYKIFELGSARLKDFLSPKVLWKFMGRIITGWLPSMGYTKDDLFQLGGDFVVDTKGDVVYAFKSSSPAERPTIPFLLEQLQEAHPNED